MAKQKYERGKLSLRGTKAVQPEVQTERAVEELSKKTVSGTTSKTPAKEVKEKKQETVKTKPVTRKAKSEPVAPTKVKTQRFTVDFPEDRYFEFKMEALRRRTTVKNMLLEAMKKTYGL